MLKINFYNHKNTLEKADVAASACKDENWFTFTCKLGWPVQGIFPTAAFDDVNCACRSYASKKVDDHFEFKYLATGDDGGKINLYKYPVVT